MSPLTTALKCPHHANGYYGIESEKGAEVPSVKDNNNGKITLKKARNLLELCNRQTKRLEKKRSVNEPRVCHGTYTVVLEGKAVSGTGQHQHKNLKNYLRTD